MLLPSSSGGNYAPPEEEEEEEACSSSNEEGQIIYERRNKKCGERKKEVECPTKLVFRPPGILVPFPLRIFLLISVLIKLGNCCMPGYEGERASLRQYLGIEWSPGGLTKMDAEPPRFVRHSDDLNCDFAQPDKCKWQNMPKGNGFDSLDFHLFRKEDNTEFPILQIRPGPSKIPVGDQLLLTGDRRRSEQSAILLSHPIKCQNSTGRLTFTFWVYNGARIEVLIFSENEEGLHVLPEKPQVDCGTVQVNTECTVPIPPRDQPFRIAIRAYDIRHPEGSFVMIDTILYEAQFCRVSIDFGPDFHAEPLLTGANGEFVQSAAELNCAEFDGKCRWRNSGHGELGIWKRALGQSPPSMMLFNETGTHLQPTLPAAFLYIPEGTHPASGSNNNANNLYRMLSSDPIECSETSSITLQFRVWSTKGIQLSCCLMEFQTQRSIGECQPIQTSISPAPIQLRFNSNAQKFMFSIRVDSVNADFDNFVILDEFEVLDAGGCGQLGIEAAQKGWLVDGGLYTAPMLSTLLNRPIHSAKDLNCDFAKRALNCQWANLDRLEEGMSPWEIGTLGSGKNKRNPLPVGDVALTRLDSANGSAVLLSEQIQCTHDEGTTLSFRHWQSGETELGVCIVRANSLEVLDCQNTKNDQNLGANSDGEQILVEIPRLDEPVRLAIRAESRNEQGGLVAVDDIQLEGNVCASSLNAIAFAGRSGYGRIGRNGGQYGNILPGGGGNVQAADNSGWHALPDENVCRLLSCNFNNEGNMCLFTSSRIASSVSMFRAYNQSAFAMLFTRSRVAMLESPLFHLNAPARLHFDFSIKKGPANLHICQDSVMRELDSCFAIFQSGETAGWKHDFVEVLPTDRKFYFIAKMEGSGKATIQLDNLELTDVRNHRIC